MFKLLDKDKFDIPLFSISTYRHTKKIGLSKAYTSASGTIVLYKPSIKRVQSNRSNVSMREVLLTEGDKKIIKDLLSDYTTLSVINYNKASYEQYQSLEYDGETTYPITLPFDLDTLNIRVKENKVNLTADELAYILAITNNLPFNYYSYFSRLDVALEKGKILLYLHVLRYQYERYCKGLPLFDRFYLSSKIKN